MAWLYMTICAFDFIILPIYFIMAQGDMSVNTLVQWQPITLVSGGLFHGAMGAIIGLTAWGRSKEKMAFGPNGEFVVEQESQSITGK
jgi:hypothetical protein